MKKLLGSQQMTTVLTRAHHLHKTYVAARVVPVLGSKVATLSQPSAAPVILQTETFMIAARQAIPQLDTALDNNSWTKRGANVQAAEVISTDIHHHTIAFKASVAGHTLIQDRVLLQHLHV